MTPAAGDAIIRSSRAPRVGRITGLTACLAVAGAVLASAPPGVADAMAVNASPQNAEELMHEAGDAAARGDWASARDLLVRADRIDPDRADLLLELGIAFENTAQPREALAAYRAALAAQPDMVAAIENLAALLAEQGDFDGGVHVLTAALQRMPEQASLHYHRALLILRREQDLVAPAVEGLRRAHDLGYARPHLYLLLGRVERARGNAADARGLLQRGLDQAPEDPELLREMGLATASLGDMEAATASFRQAVSHAPQDPSIAADLGRFYLQTDRPAEALELLVPHDSDDDPGIVYLIGQAQRALGRPEARETLQRHQELQASAQARDEAATRALVEVGAGVARWQEGDLAAAAEHFERALQERPGWAPALAYLAAAHYESGDLDAAVSIAEDLLESDPGNAQALMVLGRANMATSPARALELLEQAAELYPFRAVCLLTLAEAYVQVGRFADAGALVERAAAVEPDNPWAADLRRRLAARNAP